MDLPKFLRLQQLRSHNIMWFLGAGASASSGVPTAHHLTWEFKRVIYCTEQRVSRRACSDLSDPALRARIQQYFDSLGTYPPQDAPDEYAFYFEVAYPDERDRRKVLETHTSGAKPSYGHFALAGLMKANKVRMTWTTNFDRTIEDAVAQAFESTSKLTCATLDNSSIAMQAQHEGRWPFLGKLHGDFHSRRLKNTTEELRQQDANLRDALVHACQRNGLAVVGYSGRDDSIIDALSRALVGPSPFPSGFFWFYREDVVRPPGLSGLATAASARGVDLHFVQIETFDELLTDVVNLTPDLPVQTITALDKRLARVGNAPLPAKGKNWPVIRLNALPVLGTPAVCRRVVCSIGGARAVRDAIKAHGSKIVGSRRNVGVLAFGRDEDVRNTFSDFAITAFDLHPLDPARMRDDSAELVLIYDALAKALVRTRPLVTRGTRRGHILACNPDRADDDLLEPLRRAIGRIAGAIKNSNFTWSEAIRFRLEHRLDRFWLLVEPTIWVGQVEEYSQPPDPVRDFVRARLAARYNATWNSLLDAWSHILTDGADPAELRAFGIDDGLDAVFRLGKVTAFSAR